MMDSNEEDAAMGLFKNYVSQTRKPEGVLGKMMINGMNSGHAKMADWGISHLEVSTPKEDARFSREMYPTLHFLKKSMILLQLLKLYISGLDLKNAFPKLLEFLNRAEHS